MDEIIKAIREAYGKKEFGRPLTQKELADMLGTSRAAVSFYESGERWPGRQIFNKLIELSYECDIDINWKILLSSYKSKEGKNDE